MKLQNNRWVSYVSTGGSILVSVKGLKDRQIWAIISYAKKAGKIKQVKRGVYVGA